MKYMFFGIGSLILFTIAIGAAFIYAKGFHFSPSGTRIMIALGAIAPLIFFGAVLMGRSLPITPVTNTLYTIIMSLGGIIFYVFIGAIIIGILLLIAALTKSTLPLWATTVVFSLSILLGILGIIQGKTSTVRTYTVTLPNLPTAWEGKKVVLVSDTHFGQVNSDRFARKVIDRILSLNPDVVLHAGDFYDGAPIKTGGITKEFSRLTEIAPVFYAPGNHEEYGAYEAFIESTKQANITVLEDALTTYDGVQIAGIKYRGNGVSEDLSTVFTAMNIDTNLSTILINHPPTFQSIAKNAGVDLMVSGHTHNGQFWPLNYIVNRIYGKYTYGVAIDEGITTVTTSGIGTWGPPLRLFNTPELVVLTLKNK